MSRLHLLSRRERQVLLDQARRRLPSMRAFTAEHLREDLDPHYTWVFQGSPKWIVRFGIDLQLRPWTYPLQHIRVPSIPPWLGVAVVDGSHKISLRLIQLDLRDGHLQLTCAYLARVKKLLEAEAPVLLTLGEGGPLSIEPRYRRPT